MLIFNEKKNRGKSIIKLVIINMEGKKYYKILSLFLIGIFSFWNFEVAHGASYGATPMIMDLKAEARDIIKKSITITNEGSEKLDLYPTVNNVSVDEQGVQEFQDIQEADKSTSLANWIQFPRAVIELDSGESKTIVFTIQVNLEAKPGTYHARISFPAGSTREKAEEELDNSPFVMINLEVTEKVNELLGLKKFLSDKTFFVSLPANLSFSLENIGNKETVPRGEVIIYDHKGKEVGNTAINVEGKKISPGNVSDFKTEINKSDLFGRYKAYLSVNYGENQKGTITDTIYFYVIPWQKLAIIFSVAMASTWLLSIWIHKRRSGHELSHYGALSHNVFHPSHPAYTSHSARHPGRDHSVKLRKEAIHVQKKAEPSHHHRLTLKGHKKTHPGHVTDLRKHKKSS